MIYLRTFGLVLCSLFFIFSAEGNCATIAAKSPSQADVQAAVNSAGDGDTVTIPAGSATWSSTVNISNKGVSVVGAGKGNTIITCSNAVAFSIQGTLGKFFRIAEMTLRGYSPSYMIRVTGTSQAWRIDHIHFDNIFSGRSTGTENGAILVDGYTYGLIDNNLMDGPSPVTHFVMPYQGAWTTGDFGRDSWNRPLSLGTANAVYIENNTVSYDTFAQTNTNGVWDSRSGGRYVVRYNTFKNVYAGHHGAETYSERGTFSFEIYNNTWTYTAHIWKSLNMRGGTGVIFNNTWYFVDDPGGTGPWAIGEYRAGNTQASGIPWNNTSCDGAIEYMCARFVQPSQLNASGPSDAKCTYGCIQIDGQREANGWPCRDQIGVTYNGLDDKIQASSPLYEWNNNYYIAGAGPRNANNYVHSGSSHIVKGRDFFDDTQRPGYTPYTHPHPLASGGGGDPATAPGAPSNLRVQ